VSPRFRFSLNRRDRPNLWDRIRGRSRFSLNRGEAPLPVPCDRCGGTTCTPVKGGAPVHCQVCKEMLLKEDEMREEIAEEEGEL